MSLRSALPGMAPEIAATLVVALLLPVVLVVIALSIQALVRRRRNRGR